jgi:recombination protein RecR
MEPSQFLPGALSVSRLIQAFNRLPGIGPKPAQRLTYHLIRMDEDEAYALSEAIRDVKEKIDFCKICQNITEINPCGICSDSSRDPSKLCVVEEPLDVLALERTGAYSGLYHVLHGAISPMNNIGPNDLRLNDLLSRISTLPPQELIIATNPNLEGEATAMYINGLLEGTNMAVTRLAKGLPMGGDLEYADPSTLYQAFEGRKAL